MAIRIEDLYEPSQVLEYPVFPEKPVNVRLDNIVRTATDLSARLAGEASTLKPAETRLDIRGSETRHGARDGARAIRPVRGELGAMRPRRQVIATERAVLSFGAVDAGMREVRKALGEPDLTAEEPDWGIVVGRTRDYVRGAAEVIGKARPR